MTYLIDLRGRDGDPFYFSESLLPGFLPARVLEMMAVQFVDDVLGLCRNCHMDCHCHVLIPAEKPGPYTAYAKFCTILFHDAIRPPWALEDVV